MFVGAIMSTSHGAWAQSVIVVPGAPTAPPPVAVPPATTAAAPAPAPAPGAMPPDIVRLKSGGFVRGVILELDPATRTIIQTDVGRREIPASDVVYAGSAGRDPFLVPSAPPTSVPPIAPVRLAPTLPLIELRSETPSVQFFIWTGVDSYKGTGQSDHLLGPSWTTSGTANSFRPLCIAPCSTPLAEGSYRMGLARKGEQPVLLQGNVEVRRGVPLRAEYTTDQRSRALPIGIIVTGAVLTLGGAGLGLQALGDGEEGGRLGSQQRIVRLRQRGERGHVRSGRGFTHGVVIRGPRRARAHPHGERREADLVAGDLEGHSLAR